MEPWSNFHISTQKIQPMAIPRLDIMLKPHLMIITPLSLASAALAHVLTDK